MKRNGAMYRVTIWYLQFITELSILNPNLGWESWSETEITRRDQEQTRDRPILLQCWAKISTTLGVLLDRCAWFKTAALFVALFRENWRGPEPFQLKSGFTFITWRKNTAYNHSVTVILDRVEFYPISSLCYTKESEAIPLRKPCQLQGTLPVSASIDPLIEPERK